LEVLIWPSSEEADNRIDSLQKTNGVGLANDDLMRSLLQKQKVSYAPYNSLSKSITTLATILGVDKPPLILTRIFHHYLPCLKNSRRDSHFSFIPICTCLIISPIIVTIVYVADRYRKDIKEAT